MLILRIINLESKIVLELDEKLKSTFRGSLSLISEIEKLIKFKKKEIHFITLHFLIKIHHLNSQSV